MSYMVPQRVYILQSKLIKSQDVFNGAKRSAARLWLVNIYYYNYKRRILSDISRRRCFSEVHISGENSQQYMLNPNVDAVCSLQVDILA